MKRTILLLLISLVLTSCNPVKRNSSSQQHTTVQSETHTGAEQKAVNTGSRDLEQEQKSSSSGIRETETTSGQVTVRVVEEFDTSLPVDPDTGTPPIRSRTTEVTGSNEQSRQAETTEEQTETTTSEHEEYQEDVDTKITRQANENSETDTTTEETEKQGRSVVKWMIACVILGIILIIILYLKIRKKF